MKKNYPEEIRETVGHLKSISNCKDLYPADVAIINMLVDRLEYRIGMKVP